MSEQIETPIKRGPGRPRKYPLPEGAVPKIDAPSSDAAKSKFKMKAKPNWEEIDPFEEETPDKLRIAPELVPEGMALQWVTDSVFGQPMPQHRAQFEKRGWTPVHQEDFDGVFDGMFMPRGSDGEIRMGGMVLMARPKELSDRARLADRKRALEQVNVKEAQLRGGDLSKVTLDASHPSAVRTNRINKSIERIDVPKD